MNQEKFYTIRQARAWLQQKPLFLDTETTGLSSVDQIIDLAVIDHDGRLLINTFIQPTVPITSGAAAIHHIGPNDVASAPLFCDVLPALTTLIKNRLIIIYNADFDLRMIQQSANRQMDPIRAECAMTSYAAYHGEINARYGDYKWQSQDAAARQLGLPVPADLHRAAADANLCRLIVEAMAKTPLPGE